MNSLVGVNYAINPYRGFSNGAYIVLDKECPNTTNDTNCVWEYDDKGTAYWFQDPKTGVTDFLYHNNDLVAVDPPLIGHFQTKINNDGFGGRTFGVWLNDGNFALHRKHVDIRGPWSGGCYCANNFLPLPATEVTYRTPSPIQGHWHWTCGNMAIAAVNHLLEVTDSSWRCKLYPRWAHLKVPEFVYDDKRKEEWTSELMDFLAEEWNKFNPLHRAGQHGTKVKSGSS